MAVAQKKPCAKETVVILKEFRNRKRFGDIVYAILWAAVFSIAIIVSYQLRDPGCGVALGAAACSVGRYFSEYIRDKIIWS